MKASRNCSVLLLCALVFLAGCSVTPRRPPVATPAPAPPDTNVAALVSQIAQSMIGVPYRYGGSTPEGFDCSGLVYYAHVQAGVPVPRTAAEQHRASTPVPAQELRPGDILFFDTTWRYGHVGIYVGEGEFVHAPASGKRVSRGTIREGYFARRLKQAGRLIGQ